MQICKDSFLHLYPATLSLSSSLQSRLHRLVKILFKPAESTPVLLKPCANEAEDVLMWQRENLQTTPMEGGGSWRALNAEKGTVRSLNLIFALLKFSVFTTPYGYHVRFVRNGENLVLVSNFLDQKRRQKTPFMVRFLL